MNNYKVLLLNEVMLYVLPADSLDKNNLNLDCYLKEHYPFTENTVFDVKKYHKYYLVFVYEKFEEPLEKSRYYSIVLFILLKLQSKNFIYLEENFVLYHSIKKRKESLSIEYYEDEISLINLLKNKPFVETENPEFIHIRNTDFNSEYFYNKSISIKDYFPKIDTLIKNKRYEIFYEKNKKISLCKKLLLFLIFPVIFIFSSHKLIVQYKGLQQVNKEALVLKKKINDLKKNNKKKLKSENILESNLFYEVISLLNEIEINYSIKSFVMEDSRFNLQLYSKNAYDFYSKVISIPMFSKLKLSNVSVYENGEIFTIEGELCLV